MQLFIIFIVVLKIFPSNRKTTEEVADMFMNEDYSHLIEDSEDSIMSTSEEEESFDESDE